MIHFIFKTFYLVPSIERGECFCISSFVCRGRPKKWIKFHCGGKAFPLRKTSLCSEETWLKLLNRLKTIIWTVLFIRKVKKWKSESTLLSLYLNHYLICSFPLPSAEKIKRSKVDLRNETSFELILFKKNLIETLNRINWFKYSSSLKKLQWRMNLFHSLLHSFLFQGKQTLKLSEELIIRSFLLFIKAEHKGFE